MASDLLLLNSAFVSGVRHQFRLDADTSEVWTLFACVSGSIHFRLDLARAVVGGEVMHAVSGPEGRAEFGDVVLCPPGVRFHRHMTQPSAFLWARFESGAGLPVGSTPVSDLQRLAGNVERLAREFELRAKPITVAPQHYVTDIVLQCIESQLAATAARDGMAERAARVLTSEFANPEFRIGELAVQLHVSPAVLTRRFTAAFGCTPVAYLRDLRLQRARMLLLETTETLAAVAKSCGYTDPFYFTRVFTRVWGMSPSQYRRDHRF